jgi:hypothetical protein
MSIEQHDDTLVAAPQQSGGGKHDFRLSGEVDTVQIYRRMVCTVCGQRMNEAAPVCPGRKPE